MNAKIIQIKIFNDLLDQFMEYLLNNFIYIKSDIILAKNTITFVRNSNPRLVVEKFMKNIYPYQKQIFECDEDFFMNFDKNMSDDDKKRLSNDDFLMGMKFKSVWSSKDTSVTQKAHIWMYFQKLIRAGEKVVM